MHWLLSIILNCYPLLPTHFSILSVMTNCAVESSKAKLWFLIQSRPKSAPTTPSEWRERAIWSLKSGLSSPHFGVHPPVHPTFWRGCRRATSTNDPANERARACHKAPSFKNIGLGGVPASNQALNSSESVCIPVYIYVNTTDVTFSKKRMPTSWPQCGFAAKNRRSSTSSGTSTMLCLWGAN